MVTVDHRSGGTPRPRRRSGGQRGFTLLEMMLVLVIGSVLVGLAALTFSNVGYRGSARRAAQVFSRDLALARSMAVRGREQVVVRFNEGSLWYEVVTQSGRELATRRFGGNGDVSLSALALDQTGDSVAFSDRGIGTLSGAVGKASFSPGAITYEVTFNSMGASQVGEL